MSRLDELLESATATEFFIALYHFTRQRDYLTSFLKIESAHYQGRRALHFSVHQMVTFYEDGESVGWGTDDVHTFTLVDNDQIIWEIKGQDPIVGLDHIKALLRQIRATHQNGTMNDLPAGAHNISGLPISSE